MTSLSVLVFVVSAFFSVGFSGVAQAQETSMTEATPFALVTPDPLIVTNAARERMCGYLAGDASKKTVCFPDLSQVPYAERATGEIKVATGMFCTYGVDGVHCSGHSYYVQLFAIPQLTNVIDLALPPAADMGVGACAITRESPTVTKAVCWGASDSLLEIPESLKSPIAISTNGNSACALSSDSYVRCWGGKESLVTLGDSPYGVRSLRKLAMSDYAACVIDAYGLMCWGPKSEVPDELKGDGTVIDVAMINSQICALTFEHQVRCFGERTYTPPELLNPIALSSIGSSICATDVDGLKCWGNLGDLAREKPVTPRPPTNRCGHTDCLDPF